MARSVAVYQFATYQGATLPRDPALPFGVAATDKMQLHDISLWEVLSHFQNPVFAVREQQDEVMEGDLFKFAMIGTTHTVACLQ
jgi:hypothetical protein